MTFRTVARDVVMRDGIADKMGQERERCSCIRLVYREADNCTGERVVGRGHRLQQILAIVISFNRSLILMTSVFYNTHYSLQAMSFFAAISHVTEFELLTG